jgi:hypothetical protein
MYEVTFMFKIPGNLGVPQRGMLCFESIVHALDFAEHSAKNGILINGATFDFFTWEIREIKLITYQP